MKNQRPILFNTEMVLAIDGDTKTETRRTRGLKELNKDPDGWVYIGDSRTNDSIPYPAEKYNPHTWYAFHRSNSNMVTNILKCPYGEPGDYLYVRETWAKSSLLQVFYYKAKYEERFGVNRWRPSMHMPKEAARIWLKVVEVRIERLKSITQLDAKNEGVIQTRSGLYKNYQKVKGSVDSPTSPLSSFITLWDSVNGAGAFHSNPWVWVVKFKKVNNPNV